MIFVDKYKSGFQNGSHTLPAEALTAEAKNKDWYLNWCQYVYSLYCNGSCHFSPSTSGINVPFGEGRSIAELRAYGRGRQPIDKYRKVFDPKYDPDSPESNSSPINISWANSLIFPKFRDVAIGKLNALSFMPKVVGIDDLAISARERMMLSDKFNAHPAVKELEMMAGVSVNQNAKTPDYADIDDLYKIGFYQLEEEGVLSSAIRTTLDINDFAAVREQCAGDVVDLHLFGYHVYSNHDGSVGIKYVDPEKLIIPKSTSKTFDDVDFVGVIEDMTIGDMATRFNLAEDKLGEIANRYKSAECGSPAGWGWTAVGNYGQLELSKGVATNRRVAVLNLYFIGVDVKKHIARQKKDGRRTYDEIPLTSKLDRQRPYAREEMTVVQNVYKASWVIGTNIILDCGLDDSIVRDGRQGNKRAVLPVIVWGSDEPSITERCVMSIDAIEIAWKKRQQAIAATPPAPNVAIDISLASASLSIGGQNYSMIELFNMYVNSGILFTATQNEWNAGGAGSNRPAVMPMPNMSAEIIAAFREDIASNIENIRMVTGLNEFSDGSANASRVLNGVASVLQQGADLAQSTRFLAFERTFRKTCKVIGEKYRAMVINKGVVSLRHIPIYSNVAVSLTIDPNVFKYQFDFGIRVLPSRDEVTEILQSILSHKEKGELSEDGFILLYDMLRRNEVDLAMRFLPKYVKDKRKSDAEAQQAAIMSQSKAQAEAAVAMEQAKQQTMTLEGQMKMDLERLKHAHSMEELRLKIQLETEKVVVSGSDQRDTMAFQKGIETNQVL